MVMNPADSCSCLVVNLSVRTRSFEEMFKDVVLVLEVQQEVAVLFVYTMFSTSGMQ